MIYYSSYMLSSLFILNLTIFLITFSLFIFSGLSWTLLILEILWVFWKTQQSHYLALSQWLLLLRCPRTLWNPRTERQPMHFRQIEPGTRYCPIAWKTPQSPLAVTWSALQQFRQVNEILQLFLKFVFSFLLHLWFKVVWYISEIQYK